MEIQNLTYFVDVVLPVPVGKTYTYRVPTDFVQKIALYKRVLVNFGKKRIYTGIIVKIHHLAPSNYTAKYIEDVLDINPIINAQQYDLWQWVSSYYMCTIGEVMKAALPSGLKLNSESVIYVNQLVDIDVSQLSDDEYILIEALKINEKLSFKEALEVIDNKRELIYSLVKENKIIISEEIKEKFKPKKQNYICLNNDFQSEEGLRGLFELLEKRAPKQVEVLMKYLQECDIQNNYYPDILQKVVSGKDNAGIVNALVKKDIFIKESKVVDRWNFDKLPIEDSKELSGAQEEAANLIEQEFIEKDIVLLHGVTGSGKTEIYIQLIQDRIEQGEQVLFLLPEIALTTQIIKRLKKHFGNQLGVYHSKYNQNEKVELWNELLKKEDSRFKIIIGTRSSIFLPFYKLGLIIVDESHETSYKQSEKNPRYHARDTALVLAKLNKAKVLLGSATPSFESYQLSKEGKYGLVKLDKRFDDVQLPSIEIVNILKARRQKEMKASFSNVLIKEIEECLADQQQIILFQNRRGYNPLWMCNQCGWVPQCKQCDINLSYHKYSHILNCHYCGYSIKPYKKCQDCDSTDLKMIGFGTEKIEDDLAVIFPDVSVARMDSDSTRSRYAYDKIIEDFQSGKTQILIGTQMISKGLDFDRVGLVGILDADSLLQFPEFRANERAYQLMIQVAGRAGRKNSDGKVIIQTKYPKHPVLQEVIKHNYRSFFQTEIQDRKNFDYPPFTRIIKISLLHKDRATVEHIANQLAEALRLSLKKRVLGPQFSRIERLRNKYHININIKFERNISANKLKKYLSDKINEVQVANPSKPHVIVDVDPVF